MSNTILTHSMIADRALYDLRNELSFSRNVYKGYNSEFNAVGRFKKGSSVPIALPNKYRTKNGATLDLVETLEQSATVTVDTQEHVALSFTMQELTLSIEDFSKKHLQPAVNALANKIDYDGTALYKGVYNSVGTPGTTPSTVGVIGDANERMDNEAIPRMNRNATWSPAAYNALNTGELKGIFNENMVDELMRQGYVGKYLGVDHFMSQNLKTHTTGTHSSGSTPVMNGATAEGASTLAIDGWANATLVLQEGDVFTIAGVYGVNPVSGEVWENNELRQFVVTADATSNGSGETTVSISPTIYSSAAGENYLPYQTVGTLPANGAAITVLGTEATGYKQNMIYTPEAFALTMVPFEKPRSAGSSVDWAQASDKDLGLSISVATAWDQTNYKESTRLDVLYGWDIIQPEYAVRVWG